MIKLFILLIFITFSFSNEKPNITLQLSWLNQFQFAGYYIAKEKGFYKEVGLDVKINEYNNNLQIADVIKNGKADFAIGRSSLIINKIDGSDIVAIAAISQNSPLMLLTTNETIKSIEDFKNKKIMITPDAEITASITAMLNSNGVYKNDLEMLKHSFDINDLITKKVDLMASYVSNEPIRLQEKGVSYKIFHPKDFGFDFYDDILFTSSEFIKNNPKTTKNFYEATIKGWEYALKNKTESAEIIHDKYNTQHKSLISLIKEAEVLEKLIINENDKQIGCLDEKKLKTILDIFKVLGLTKGDLDFNEFIYEENHHNQKIIFEIAHEEKDIVILLIVSIVIIFILTVYFLNRIHNKKKLLDAVINTSNDLIYYKNNKLIYLGCNDAFEKYAKLSKDEIIGKDDFEIFDRKFAKFFRDNDLKVLRTNNILTENEWFELDGRKILFQSKKIPFKYESGSGMGILGISRDITDLYETQKKLEEQAVIDELTKTYNRKYFNEKLQEQLELFKRYNVVFCIALFDIDNFKVVNDSYGHKVGDDVLVNICKIIKKNIRITDILFRVGGEEFIIMYRKTKIEDAFKSAEKIRELIENAQIIENHPVTISIGLTQAKENDTQESLFSRSDNLMYKSKENGKNQVTVD